MSSIGVRTDAEYKADFPLDFGSGVRGAWLHNSKNEAIGVLITHVLANGYTCGGTAYWIKAGHHHNTPLWRLISMDPLTIEPSFLCSCGFNGFITEGEWVAA